MDGESPGRGVSTDGDVAEAALAGWLQSDGFVGQYEGTNRSLTIEAMTVTPAELEWVHRPSIQSFPGSIDTSEQSKQSTHHSTVAAPASTATD